MEDFTPYPPPFRLDGRLVHPDLNRISGPDGEVRVEPRVMQVLLTLAALPGEVIPRDRILDEVWKDQIVGEENLTRAISELRRIFADDPRRPRVIETIRNHGYRLIGAVESAPEDPAPVATAPQDDPAVPGPAASVPGDTVPAGSPISRRGFPWMRLGVLAMALLVLSLQGDAWHRGGPAPHDHGPAYTAPVPLTTYPGRERHPALSPDGTRVAFVGTGGDLPPGCLNALYLKQRNLEEPLRLTSAPGWCAWPAWSPDGQSLAFVQGGEDAVTLCTVSSLGGAVRELYRSEGLIEGVDWTPDGKALVFAPRDGRAGEARLRLLDLATGQARPVRAAAGSTGEDILPHFCQRTGTLAWIHREAAGPSSLRWSAAGTDRFRERMLSRGTPGGLAWTPDGQGLVLSLAGMTGLWRADLDGGPLRKIPTGPDPVAAPTIAARTGELAYSQLRLDRDLVAIRAEGRDPWRLATSVFAPSTRGETTADFSPDGSLVALVSDRSGHPEIWLADRQGEGLRQLTSLEADAIDRVRFSPDGSLLALQIRREGVTAIGVVPAGGGAWTAIPGTDAAFLWGWVPDGHALLVTESVRGRSRPRALAVPGAPGDGSSLPVFPAHLEATSTAITAAGDTLVFTLPDRPGIWAVALAGGDPVPLVEDLAEADRRNWRLTPAGLAWVSRMAGHPYLWWRDARTGAASVVADLPGLGPGDLAVAPDGGMFVYPRQQVAASDLMLLELLTP